MGRFEFWIDGDCVEVGVGDLVYAPRNVPHSFRNLADETAHLLVISASAGSESFFRECARVWGAPDAMAQVMAQVGEIAARHGVEFVDPATTPKIGAPAHGKTPRVMRAGEGETLALPEGSGRICLSESDTAGEFALGVMEIPSLSGPPAHVHYGGRRDYSGARRHGAGAGDVVWMPRDVAHSFRCVSAQAGQLIVLFAPSDVAAYFRQFSQLLRAGQLSPDNLRAMGARYGLEFLPSM